ncbi:Npun_R2821/Npun_R2822 family protein [Calothrix sp. 336/3]|uniref:Npun_R2821/Npun_R2822 family protein n=1 Tax=Calothrix sp. 336/3 TaxID=1337936 RepID=UPI0004E2B7EC|nr:Npun_R2821/Npun_R2822 family protein [Calothrix sp. 336/3]AKG21022.1 methionine synthase [Calothrix sp. 336/3]
MTRGIYIVANDRVLENAVALLNSIRLYDPEVLIYMIPFNEEYQQLADIICNVHNVKIFPDLNLLNQFTQKIAEIFPPDFLALPNKMRKLAVWFGPLDEFLYIDTDIIVFEKIAENLNLLSQFDFLCCDFHYKSEGLRNVFSPLVAEENIFTTEQLADVFNSGFWASRKGIISMEKMEEILRECATHREYFDFTSGVTDQPILNYLVLKSFARRCNLVKLPGQDIGSWGGSSHFQEKDYILYDSDRRLKYLHWAGTPLKGGAYWKLWQHYRYLHEGKPTLWKKLLLRR